MGVNRTAEARSTFQAVGAGFAVGGTIALVSYVMQKWLGRQRQIYMEIGLPLSVVSGTLTGVWMCAEKPQQKNVTPLKKRPIPPHSSQANPSQEPPNKPLQPRKLFEGGETPSVLPSLNFHLSFNSPQKTQKQLPSDESCSVL